MEEVGLFVMILNPFGLRAEESGPDVRVQELVWVWTGLDDCVAQNQIKFIL